MAFIDKLKQFATGKSESERKQYAIRNKMIVAKSRAAGFEEKEKQEIRLAIAKQKAYYDRKVTNLNTKKKYSQNSSLQDMFGINKFDYTKKFKVI